MNKIPGQVKVLTSDQRPGEKSKLRVLLKLGRYLFKYKYLLLLALVMTIFSNTIALIGPSLAGKAINAITETPVNFERVYIYAAMMAAIYIISSGFSFVLSLLMIRISKKIAKQMRSDIFEKLMRLKISYFDTHQTGDIVSRITYDIDTINASLSTDFVQILTSIITVVGSIIMMLSLSPEMCIIFVVTVPATIIYTIYMTRRVRPLFRARSAKLGEMNGYAEEMMSGQKTIRAYGREEEMISRFEKRNADAAGAYYKADYYGSIMGPCVNGINNISLALISVVGAFRYISGAINIDVISSFVLYSRKFTGPINETANIISELQSTAAAAERIFRLLDEAEEASDIENAYGVTETEGIIKADRIEFSYVPDKKILKNFNFETKPGTITAIVGPTGAGKTTILNLLMRFYDPQSGCIRIDGTDIAEIKRKDVRRLYTMVLQDTWLFSGTIAENIAYGSKRDLTRDEIENAARAVGMHSFIKGLPDGYETQINEEGVNISKGQKQLLTIARAMISDSPILFLDEATSNVDSRTEMKIQEVMFKLMKNKTCFVIAHRLSTVKNADQILVVKDGEIIESGTHEELLASKGFYYSLDRAQFTTSVD